MPDENLEIQVKLTLDDSEVDPALARIAAKAGKQMPSPKMGLDTAAAQRNLGQVDAKAKTVQGTLAKSTALRVDAAPAHRGIEEIKAHFVRQKGQIEAMAIQPKVVGGGLSDFSSGVNVGKGGVGSALGGLGGMSTMGKLGLAGGLAGAAATPIILGLKASASAAIQEQKLTSITTRAYGGTAFVDSAKQLADQTGFLAADFMEAALQGKALVNNYGLQKDQLGKLIERSADLAAESPYEDIKTVSDAMRVLTSAASGNARATEQLGVSTNDSYMKTVAYGGALKDTWSKLDEATQWQYRYQEILRQTNDVLGAAKDETNVDAKVRKLNESLGELKVAVGDELLEPMGQFVDLVRQLVDAIPDKAPGVVAAGVGTPLKAMGEAIPKNWLDVANLPNKTIQLPAQIVGQTLGMVGAALWPGTGKGQTAKVDVNVNVNNNNNSQIDASASAPAPH